MKTVSLKTLGFALLAMVLALASGFAQSTGKTELLDRYYAKVMRPFMEGALTAGLREGEQKGAPDFSTCPAGGAIYNDMMKTRMPAFFRGKFDGDFKRKLMPVFDKSLTEADLRAVLRFIETDEGRIYQQRLLDSQGKDVEAITETKAYREDADLRSYHAHVQAADITQANPISELDLEKDAEWQALMTTFQGELMGAMMGCASESAPAKDKAKGG